MSVGMIERAREAVFYPVSGDPWTQVTGLSEPATHHRRRKGMSLPKLRQVRGLLGAYGEDIERWKGADELPERVPCDCGRTFVSARARSIHRATSPDH